MIFINSDVWLTVSVAEKHTQKNNNYNETEDVGI